MLTAFTIKAILFEAGSTHETSVSFKSAMMRVFVSTSETSGNFSQTMRRKIFENSHLQGQIPFADLAVLPLSRLTPVTYLKHGHHLKPSGNYR
jgi:hypothetical protein